MQLNNLAGILLGFLVCLGLAGCGSGASTGSPNAANPPSGISAKDAAYEVATGMNPHPVILVRPSVAPLSVMAQLGKAIFYDKTLSGSGQMSCATCHDPGHFYGPPTDAPVVLGGADMHAQGVRAVPSLMYLERQPEFSIGPEPSGDIDVAPNLNQQAGQAQSSVRSTKTANSTAASAQNLVPEGGLFWDGRVNTLQSQADGPLFNPIEMDAGSTQIVLKKLQNAPYANMMVMLFGNQIFSNADQAISEAMFAVARYQIEDPSFHPYSSKYDAWLEGKAKFTPQEVRGYFAFNDPKKGNCAACHLDQPSKDGLPPLFTDHEFEALGIPRNSAIKANLNPNYFDLGICGPYRKDLKLQTQYCGLFITPSLRNTAERKIYFHNGFYHSLKGVLDFYNFRDIRPEKIYPINAAGVVDKYNDVPAAYQKNIDVIDPPFDRHRGEVPAMSDQDMRDIIAFLKTLTDGYVPPKVAPTP